MPAGPGTYGSKRGRPPLSGKEKAQAQAKKRIRTKNVKAKATAVKTAVKKGLTSSLKSVKTVGKTLLQTPTAEKRKALRDAMKKRHNARKKK